MSVDYFYDGLMVIGPQHTGGGKSAYAYAVEGGYIGTEEEFGIRLAALLNGGITATVDTDTNRITLSGTLVPGTYTAYYEVQNDDGTKSLLEIGELALGSVTPETKPYTVTFVADGVTVAEVKYAVGDTIEEPAVPAKAGYTGEWETYDLSNGGNITVNAIYTAIETEGSVTTNITLTNDIRIGSDGTDRTQAGYCATPHIDLTYIPKPCTIQLTKAYWCDAYKTASMVRVHAAKADGTTLFNDITNENVGDGYISVIDNSDGIGNDVTVTVTSAEVATIRFSGHWSREGVSDSTNSFANAGTKATLTYTPAS